MFPMYQESTSEETLLNAVETQGFAIVKNSNEAYHSSFGLSRSSLVDFMRCPAFFKYKRENKDLVETTPAMALGSAVHTAVLENELFNQTYAVMPLCDRRTKEGKQLYEAFLEESQGKTILSAEQYDTAQQIAKKFNTNEYSHFIYNPDSMVEHSIYFRHEPSGLILKVRPDIWNHDLIGDLKTCRDASKSMFQSAMARGYYNLQGAMIREALKAMGIKMKAFILFCVETTPPFLMANYLLDDEALDYGQVTLNSVLQDFSTCLFEDDWPEYKTDYLSMPKWAMYQDLSILE